MPDLPTPWTSDGRMVVAANGAAAGIAETEQIARLMAAAPDLLEACKWMLDWLTPHHGDSEEQYALYAQAAAAIAKAAPLEKGE